MAHNLHQHKQPARSWLPAVVKPSIWAQKLSALSKPSAPEQELIPVPHQLPNMNRRQFLKLSLAATTLATLSTATPAAHKVTLAASPVDETGPIGKKWLKLGGQPVVGAPTSEVVQTPDNAAQYQRFENGVIVYSVDWGAMLVSVAIFEKWLSLNDEVNGDGENLLSYIGFPKQDFVNLGSLNIGYFERGMLVVDLTTQIIHVIYGWIYEHYWFVQDAMGLPIANETDAVGGGRYQAFERGDIYWQRDLGAFAVRGAIRQRWLDLGGAKGILGYPLSDEETVKLDVAVIGYTNRFQYGTIYYSDITGAWEVTGRMRHYYEDEYGGPCATLGLGLPTSTQGTTPTSGGIFQNFQKGVMIFHTDGPYKGLWIFSKLQLYIQRLQGNGEDCWLGSCGVQDLYVHILLQNSDGLNLNIRRPGSGEYDGGTDLQEAFELTPNEQFVHSNLAIRVYMEGWDHDDTSKNDHLGTIDLTYTIDNLWGVFDGGVKQNGGFVATFSIRNPISFDPLQFRQQMWWSFKNFETPKLTYDQFAATFVDVDTEEAVWRHPFNHLYYQLAYKSIADGGNCFGMSLESVFAQTGRSLYAEPIIRFWPDTQNGGKLEANNPLHQPTIHEINIKQGYQIGAGQIDWFLYKFVTGQDHNPIQCFIDSREAFQRGDYPILALSDNYLFGKAHAVRPYAWDDSNPNNWVIYIANPNSPQATHGDQDASCRIDIDTAANRFIYYHENNEVWSGDGNSGGRMYDIPFSILSSQPRTPFAEIMTLITHGMFLLLGDTGRSKQITDDAGRTFYDPNLTELPTRWDQIRQAPNDRIPNLARVPLTDGSSVQAPCEIYYGRGTGGTYKHEIVSSPNVASGTPYEWTMHSATLSASLMIPGTPNAADLITTHAIGSPEKAITVTIPANGEHKQIAWTMAGAVKQRWIELTNLQMAPGQSITIRLTNGGYEATFENSGPITTSDLRVQAGPGATPVSIGTITLDSDKPVSIQFESPLTTLQFVGDTRNSSGWMVGPVYIELTARDYSSRGITAIEYGNDSLRWASYTKPFIYSKEGISTLYYRSKDGEGNLEGANSQVFKIDTQPPVTTLTIGEPQLVGELTGVTSNTPLTLMAVDMTSGVRSVSYRFFKQGNPIPEFTVVSGHIAQFNLTGATGLYELHTFTTDVAGNDEDVHVQQLQLVEPSGLGDITEPQLPSVINQVFLPLVTR